MKKIIVLAVFSFLFVVGCKGTQGEVGPQGVQGGQGVQGIQGNPGSEIVYSEWLSFSNNLWNKPIKSVQRIEIPLGKGASFYNPETDILLLYSKHPIYAHQLLPAPDVILQTIFWRYYIRTVGTQQSIRLDADGDGGVDISTYNFSDYKFRWVIIRLLGKPYTGRKATIDYSDYDAVKKAYNIPD